MSSACVIFRCKLCQGFETEGYTSAWRRHLWTPQHQEEARKRIQSSQLESQEKKRLVVVFGLHAISMKDVLSYFFDCSVLTDFIFWTERTDFCVVEFISKKLRNITADQKHVISNYPVHLRLMDEIPQLEWKSICPSVPPPCPATTSVPTPDGTNNSQYNETDNQRKPTPTPAPLPCPSTSSTQSSRIPNKPLAFLKQTTQDAWETKSNASNDSSSSSDSSSSKSSSSSSTKHSDRDNSPSDDEVQFICETTKNANAPLIEIEDDVDDNNDKEELNTDEVSDAQMNRLYMTYRMSNDDWEFRTTVKHNLIRHLKRKQPLCRLVPFLRGSTIFGSTEDTLHLFYDRYGMLEIKMTVAHHPIPDAGTLRLYSTKWNPDHLLTYSNLTTETLRIPDPSDKFLITKVEEDLTEKIVSFKYTNVLNTIQCTIHFGDFGEVLACRLIKFYSDLDDRVRPLLLVAQHWSRYQTWFELEGNKGLSFNAVQWLVIFYLMIQKILPPVKDLRGKSQTEELTMFMEENNYNRCYEKNSWGIPSASTICELSRGMFNYFAQLKFESFELSPLIGKISTKPATDEEMVLKHPFTQNNMTRAVSFDTLMAFQESCATSRNNQILTWILTNRTFTSTSVINTTDIDIKEVLKGTNALDPNVNKRKLSYLSSSSSSSSSSSLSSDSSDEL